MENLLKYTYIYLEVLNPMPLCVLFLLSIITAAATFFEIPVVATNIGFIVIAVLSLKHFLRIQECGRLRNKLISLVKDLEQEK